MTFYIYIPNWFLGFDSILDFIIILISFLISFFSFRTYKYFKIKKFKYLSLSFFLFSISYIAKIISNLIFITPKTKTILTPLVQITYSTYEKISYIDNISFFVHKISLLLSLTILFLLITKEKKIETISLTILFSIILSIIVNSYLVFHFIIIILTLFLFLISYLYKKNKKKQINLIPFFLSLFLTYFFSFLAIEDNIFYFISEIILVLSFIFLLNKLIKTFKK